MSGLLCHIAGEFIYWPRTQQPVCVGGGSWVEKAIAKCRVTALVAAATKPGRHCRLFVVSPHTCDMCSSGSLITPSNRGQEEEELGVYMTKHNALPDGCRPRRRRLSVL